MKKKIISLLLAGIITALAGCGNTGNGVSEDSTEAPGRETEQEDDVQTGQAEMLELCSRRKKRGSAQTISGDIVLREL